MRGSEPKVVLEDQFVDGDVSVWQLRGGNKILSVMIERCRATLCASNVDGAENVPGSTTAVYRAARELMQEESRRRGADIDYTFSTSSGGMAYWAKHEGRQLFGWTSEKKFRAGADGSKILVCKARIRAR